MLDRRSGDPNEPHCDPTYPETDRSRDYFGGQVWGDFQVDVSAAPGYVANVIEEQVYLARPGLAQQDADGANTRYHHGDLINSSMLHTDSPGAAFQPVASYTAFGEPVVAGVGGGKLPPGTPRHGYAGGWGYDGRNGGAARFCADASAFAHN